MLKNPNVAKRLYVSEKLLREKLHCQINTISLAAFSSFPGISTVKKKPFSIQRESELFCLRYLHFNAYNTIGKMNRLTERYVLYIIGSLRKHTTDVDDSENVTSSENLTSRFCKHFLIIQREYACKMCSNYPGIKLEPALQR